MPATDVPKVDVRDPVALEILWGRLLSIVDESATALQRTSFSTIVRENNDFACVLLGRDGSSLAENTLGVPSFAGVMTLVMKWFLQRYPLDEWRPGDVGITNDPWMNTGHMPDTTLITPIFYRDRLVAFTGNTAHKSDIGGSGHQPTAADVFEEGLRIPICKLHEAGQPNETLLELIRANVRVPDLVIGDLEAQIAAGRVCSARLLEFLEEQGIDEVETVGSAIQARAASAMREAISALPDGDYHSVTESDGFDEPTRIETLVRVRDDRLSVDYTGTSPQVRRGINSVYNYSYAFTCYTLKCLLDPATRKNQGSYEAFDVHIPEGTILNARFPFPTMGRSMTGHFVSSAVLAALSEALPNRVIADSGSCPGLRVTCNGVGLDGRPFAQMLFPNGGMGARSNADGLSCTGFPTNAGGGSLEVLESITPMVFWRREYLADSGGAGEFRGGLGQMLEVEFVSSEPVALRTTFDRVEHPALGLFGGYPGGPSKLTMNLDTAVPSKGRVSARTGDVLRLEYAGGGGYGDPRARSRLAVAQDLKNGLISERAARDLYGYDVG